MSRTRHTPADEPHFMVRTLGAEYVDGQVTGSHSHAWGQLIYAAAGVLTVSTTGGSWVVPPTWAVWAPAGIAHRFVATGRASLRTLYVRPGLIPNATASAVVEISPLLRELILRAVAIGMLDDREPVHVALAALIVDELRVRPTPSLDLPMPHSPRLRAVADYVVESPAVGGGHAALGRRFGLGVRTLERGFAAETGLSLGRWCRQARLHHALCRLGAGASVKEAAAGAGYRSPSAFVAAFRMAFQTTPGRYFAR